MLRGVYSVLLAIYGRLPTLPRRWVVRTISPSFTVGSMVVVERSDGRLLFVRQSYRAKWGVPGGLVKRREAAEEAAVREVYEEVGLRVELIGPPGVVIDPIPQRVDVIFRARPLPGKDLDALELCSPEIKAVEWFSPTDLPELQFETAGALVELARATGAADRRPPSMEDVGRTFRERPVG